MSNRPIHRLVATAGISVLMGKNLGRTWANVHAADLVSFEGGPTAPIRCLVDPTTAEAELGSRLRRTLPEVTDPRRVSAEYSAVHALGLQKGAEVVLLHSDTFAGRAAAVLNQELLQSHMSLQVRRIQVADLDVDRTKGVQRAIADFVHQLSKVLREGHPSNAAFAPLGGYKVMTALGYLVGAYHHYPSLYLHESRQLVHRVPPVPIRVDEDDLASVADLVRRTRHGASITDVETLRDIDARPWLFERDEDDVFLGAFGHLLRDDPRYRSVLGPRVRMADPTELRGHEAWIRPQVRSLIDKLERPLDYRGELHHESVFELTSSRFALYKGASNGRFAFRAAYLYDEPTDTLDLRKVWLSHDRYESDARRVLESPYESPWTDVSATVWSTP